MEITRKKPRIFYGWWVIIACSVVSFSASSSRYAFSMFFPYLLDDLGWSRATIGFALTLHMVTNAVVIIFVGRYTDRYGARWIMAGGGIFLLLGLGLLSTVNSILEFYLYYGILTALGVAGTYLVPGLSTARKWFTRRSGLAASIVTVGSGVGLAVISPLSASLIGAYGWRSSYLIIAVAAGLVAVIASSLFVRKDPESVGLLPDGASSPELSGGGSAGTVSFTEDIWTLAEAIKTRSFWVFIFTSALGGLNGVIAHMGAWGADIALQEGFTLDRAGGIIGSSIMVMAFCAIASRMTAGFLSDYLGRKPLIYTFCIIQGITFFYALNVDSLASFRVFAILNGLSYGITMPIWAPFLGDIFGRLSVATLFGVISFVEGMVGGFGATIYGWIYDSTGSYNAAFIMSITTLFLTAALVTLIRPEEKPVPDNFAV